MTPPLVTAGDDERGRKYWCVRVGSEGNYYYRLFRRNILSAAENELTAEERTVDVLAQEILRLAEQERT